MIGRLRAYLQALEDLRNHELAGDWSRFDEAFRHRPGEADAQVEQIRDPHLRASMGQYRRPRS